MTEVLVVDPLFPDAGVVERAAEVLKRGGLVACPTETVYGLMADAFNLDAVQRVFDAKGRAADHPLPVQTAANMDALCRDISPEARALMAAFFPGPLTLVLRRGPSVPDLVTGGADTVGVRMPDYPVTRAVLEAFGGPVVCPSANRTGQRAGTSAADVLADLNGRIDLIIDGGPAPGGVASTVLDVSGVPARVLREGAIGRAQLEAFVEIAE